jgi:DNA-binding beta-propeller fold protein YncE
VAGTGTAGSANGTGTAASFNFPKGLAVDTNGNLLVADTSNHLIRKISPDGVVTNVAGSGARQVVSGMPTVAGLFADGTGTLTSFNFPTGIAVDRSGNLYIADADNHRIRKITPIY